MRFVAARVVLLRGDVVPVPCGVWGAWCFRCVAVFRVGAVAPRLFGAGVARVFVSVWCALGCRRVDTLCACLLVGCVSAPPWLLYNRVY